MIATALLLMTADLQTKDLKVGTGPGAVAGDYVVVDYTGKLTNGKKFDSSIGREPFGFLLGGGQVIKGWDLGVAGMKKGGKRLLTIPADLAYGDRGAGKDIPGGATLVFEVELKKIVRVAIEPVKEGVGYAAKFGDSVELHYVGTLTDGKKFDSSRDRGEAFLVTIGRGVIPGFSQGLLGIKAGEVRKVTIPAELAYGKKAIGGVIPANSDLVFELEALKIIPAKD